MNILFVFLSIILLVSLILDYLYEMKTENSFEIVRKMGMGYNIGNTFDSFNISNNPDTPDKQIGLNGNIAPTKDMIKKIKKYGFKTIRFPVTWMYFLDDEGKIKTEWMERVKEVIGIIIKEKLYCILNLHGDGHGVNWLIRGMEIKDKYIKIWSQIANEFKDYNEYLIFESMDAVNFKFNNYFGFDFITLTNLNQAFVDTIRNSGGNNKERLLIFAGAKDDLELTCTPNYTIPNDKSNKLAVSIHYFKPNDFALGKYFKPYNWTDDSYDDIITYGPTLKWGNSLDYKNLFDNINLIKSNFIDKGIPVIISEVGVLTEEKKEIESIREYLYMVFSISSDYDGIMCCLWDTSNKIYGDMNFYDRTNDIWYDEKIKNNFLQISKGKYVKPIEFYFNTNFESTDVYYYYGEYIIDFINKKVLKIIINARLNCVLFDDCGLVIFTYNKYGYLREIDFRMENSKKQYDGTHTFTIDVSKIECYNSIEVSIEWGMKYITVNNITLEYEESFLSIDYKSLKNAISNYIYYNK